MTVESLDSNEIQRRVASMRAGDSPLSGGAAGGTSPSARRYVRPLTAAADSLIEALRIEDGIGLGLVEIDILTRGFRPTDFVIITGFAHSAKTQLVNTMILLNPEKRVLFFSLDDPAEMILAKLIAMHAGIKSSHIEARVKAGDEATIRLIRETAQDAFPNLLVVDEVIGMQAMQAAVQEATELWGAGPDAVVVDYLEMMPGNNFGDDLLANVKQKANGLKGWAKVSPYPLIVLHQGTRTNAKPGEPINLMSMGHSGEQQATIVIGCRRKREKGDLDTFERKAVEDTVTVHVVKNKRPGGRLTSYEGIDFYLDPDTGLIRSLDHSGQHRAANPSGAAAKAQAVQELHGLGTLGAEVV